jgi:hypothetical protein
MSFEGKICKEKEEGNVKEKEESLEKRMKGRKKREVGSNRVR